MKLPFFILITALVFVPSNSRGQDELLQESVFSDYLDTQRIGNLLNIPGLEFQSSMGFSFFSSNGYGSVGMGYYLGHFNLRLNSSLTLRWDVGVRSMMAGSQYDGNLEFFLPNVDLTYRPSDKFLLRFEFHQYRHPAALMRRRY